MPHGHQYDIDRIDDIQHGLMTLVIAFPVSMIVFGAGGSLAFGRYLPAQTAIVLLTLLIGSPVVAALTTYVVKRRRHRR